METDVKVPKIAKRIFWDVNYSELDYEKDRFFIIERVLNYGTWDDFIEMLKFYGKEIIRQEVVSSSYLKKEIFNFVCFYFELNPTDFKCYTRRQSNQALWNF